MGLRPLLTQSRRVIVVEFWNEFGGAGQKRRARTPDVPNARDPHSENTSGSDDDEYLGMLQEDV